jgi:chromate reductase
MSDTERLKVVGLCGSLRAASYNQAALEAAGRLMPPGMALRVASFAQFPIYCADEQERAWPSAVLALGDAIAMAEAVLICSPEYNFSVPGGLKNALDWVSRLPQQPFKGKPVAIMGAATGPVGTARMQYELRRILHGLEAQVLLKPEIFISNAKAKFDSEGQLVDEITLKFIGDQMTALERLIRREQAANQAERLAGG